MVIFEVFMKGVIKTKGECSMDAMMAIYAKNDKTLGIDLRNVDIDFTTLHIDMHASRNQWYHDSQTVVGLWTK